MKTIKKFAAWGLLLSLLISFFAPAKNVLAASSKKTIYVVSSVKVNGTTANGKENYKSSVSYNKYGLLTKINNNGSENITDTFTYDKNQRLTKFTEKIGTGDAKDINTTNYSYKNGKLCKSTRNRQDGDKVVTTYTWKNGLITSSTLVTSWLQNGKTESVTTKSSYKYKNNHVCYAKDSSNGYKNEFFITHDKKGNVTKFVYKNNSNKKAILNVSSKITYDKNKRATKIVNEFKSPFLDKAEKFTKTVTYKKITVDKKYASAIANQQWQLLNANFNSIGIGFAW
ncbi:hypothetical protein SAMN05216249_111100 [Acetitomaculum ruminis DSM 5522]|uniref:YD repeat-containing protein n=1 Tax=Acetitomaculum ruminis DSM 5522 TaxID=1120918 RepID=A0A1I0YYU2_9FIRM|nr:hypothetical protein [Acetitomaculum ruminis]SFB17388.1 hypothetical protein SAMN05216249_111100 [Acetitomaculum ruminis DSM 5522]